MARTPGSAADPRASAAELLAQADAARAAGDGAAAHVALVEALHTARAAGDEDLAIEAATRLPSNQQFGLHPGQVPALLHEAYVDASEPAARARLAAALARAWVYGGDTGRAVDFAVEAESIALGTGDQRLLADALDASLLVHWGPDDFPERVRLAARLAEVAAHLTDTEARLAAALWRLTTAWECLDVVAVQRQLRALDVLAEESASPRVELFAVSRRAMHALVVGDLALADELIARTRAVGERSAEPDREAVLHSLNADRARQAGDVDVLVEEAAAYETFGAEEGVPSIQAEAAALWLEVGEGDRAASLVRRLGANCFDDVARDVDFLLTVALLVGVAAALGMDDVASAGAEQLVPYAGRAVLNAGAVAFHGVVDDYLYRASRALGRADADGWRHAALTSYRRIGASWWERRLGAPPAPAGAPRVVALHPVAGGTWVVGDADHPATLPDLKGLHYLRMLVARPGADVTALTLSDAVAGHPGTTAGGDAGELLDATALAAYRRRLAELDAEIDEATSWHDPAREERLARERDALVAELASATGLGGRSRRAGAIDERARVAVRKAVATALGRVDAVEPALGRLLRDTIRTGSTCSYRPDPARPVTWELDVRSPPPR